MSYIVLRPADFLAVPDVDNFNTSCLTEKGLFLFNRHSYVYYTDDEDCKNINDMSQLK